MCEVWLRCYSNCPYNTGMTQSVAEQLQWNGITYADFLELSVDQFETLLTEKISQRTSKRSLSRSTDTSTKISTVGASTMTQPAAVKVAPMRVKPRMPSNSNEKQNKTTSTKRQVYI